ncbi:hypothetical protein [Brevibacillus choshinensis]|uniref:Tetratricopeptide repeat protein n=1 Tax=Brevibacillus choshinensis TaxID=54911 RepID=A0ABX7FTS2_BRECH|nr:hypothetical protein [Brevibacillus choshinensis]QRG69476.1 hypothetical protein JNE38_10305 [Brevibacillus choshinensis]
MIASEIIGLAALLLVLIFFYTRILFHKLRSVLILILAFASAGLVGYSSASSIGIGWTISLAILVFAGVAISVIFLQKQEDLEIEQQFEIALRSEQPLLITPTAEEVAAPIWQQREEQQPIHITASNEAELPGVHLEVPADTEATSEASSTGIPEEIANDDLAIQTEDGQVPAVTPLHDLDAQEDTVSLQAHLPADSPPAKAETELLPENRTRIQALSAEAEIALQHSDYLRAYQSLREALRYNPPITATYILSKQLVQVLNEMGLYEESISVMEKVLSDNPALSRKKREDFSKHISYLEALIQELQLENKRNLSWSLVPPAIHDKVVTHFRTLLAGSNDRSTAIPFH